MPESVRDRPTRSHEYIFLLSKSAKYFFDQEAVKEKSICSEPIKRKRPNGLMVHCGALGYSTSCGSNAVNRNIRSVWTISTKPFKDWQETFHWKRVQDDDISGDKRGIVLLDSQADGGLFDLLAMILCDGHGEKEKTRNADIYSRLSLVPQDGFVPIDQLHAYCFHGENLDSFLRKYFPSAILHNSESRKTGPFVLTSPSYKPCAEKSGHIEHTLKSLGLSEQYRGMLLNNIWPDVMDAHLWEEILYCKLDNISSSYSIVYRKAREMSSHFATFPLELPERCIKAGTSEKGYCPKCGKPWVRIIERTKYKPSIVPDGQRFVDASRRDKTRKLSGKEYNEQASCHTLGWRPSCDCSAGDPIPGLVLDPFFGAGTVGVVAKQLGRNYIGIELNPKYCKMAKRRIGKVAYQPELAIAL